MCYFVAYPLMLLMIIYRKASISFVAISFHQTLALYDHTDPAPEQRECMVPIDAEYHNELWR